MGNFFAKDNNKPLYKKGSIIPIQRSSKKKKDFKYNYYSKKKIYNNNNNVKTKN